MLVLLVTLFFFNYFMRKYLKFQKQLLFIYFYSFEQMVCRIPFISKHGWTSQMLNSDQIIVTST